jgi:hypothetical protein
MTNQALSNLSTRRIGDTDVTYRLTGEGDRTACDRRRPPASLMKSFKPGSEPVYEFSWMAAGSGRPRVNRVIEGHRLQRGR